MNFSFRMIYNNMIYDSFFIKATMLSQYNNEEHRFGAITIGATFRYLVTTLDDQKFIQVAS